MGRWAKPLSHNGLISGTTDTYDRLARKPYVCGCPRKVEESVFVRFRTPPKVGLVEGTFGFVSDGLGGHPSECCFQGQCDTGNH
jgi:hypothetical protein